MENVCQQAYYWKFNQMFHFKFIANLTAEHSQMHMHNWRLIDRAS